MQNSVKISPASGVDAWLSGNDTVAVKVFAQVIAAKSRDALPHALYSVMLRGRRRRAQLRKNGLLERSLS